MIPGDGRADSSRVLVMMDESDAQRAKTMEVIERARDTSASANHSE